MRTYWILPLLLAASSAAYANECESWKAGMEETEGGSAMVARICSAEGDIVAELSLQCGGGGQWMIRMIPSVAENYPPGEDYNFTTRFSLDNGKEKAELDMHYEGMDAAMAGDVKADDRLVGLLKSGHRVTFSDSSGKLPASSFTLKGASEALETLEAACRAP